MNTKVRNNACALLLSTLLAFLGCATAESRDQFPTDTTQEAALAERLQQGAKIADPYLRLLYYDQLVLEAFGISASQSEPTTEADQRTSPELETERANNDLAHFQALGELRGVTADRPRWTFIIEPVLGYDATNRELYSELTQCTMPIRQVIDRYFSDREAADLLGAVARQRVKANLREEINAMLRTGTIEDVAFVQYQIVDF